jgi:hypothetical protein
MKHREDILMAYKENLMTIEDFEEHLNEYTDNCVDDVLNELIDTAVDRAGVITNNQDRHALQIANEIQKDGQLYRYVHNTFIQVARLLKGKELDFDFKFGDELNVLRYIHDAMGEAVRSLEDAQKMDEEESLE